jgi:hypothetical protein
MWANLLHSALKGMIMWSPRSHVSHSARLAHRGQSPDQIPTVAVDPPVVQAQHTKCLAEFSFEVKHANCDVRAMRHRAKLFKIEAGTEFVR